MNSSTAQNLPIGKIASGDVGLGTVTAEMVDKRALELAKSDGRTMPHEGDRATARAELVGPDRETAPEISDPGLGELTEWDSPVESNGHRAVRVLPEDEVAPAEILVEEGIEEADHDQRVRASEVIVEED